MGIKNKVVSEVSRPTPVMKEIASLKLSVCLWLVSIATEKQTKKLPPYW